MPNGGGGHSDWDMDPTERQIERHRAAKCLVYLSKKLNIGPPDWAVHDSKTEYGKDDRSESNLCTLIENMSEEQRETIIYDAHSRDSRDLANWWEECQEVNKP